MPKVSSTEVVTPLPDQPLDTISDPVELLDILKKAILRQPVNMKTATDAVRQVLSKYEAQHRLFLIAAANAELPRVVRLITFINSCEDKLMYPATIQNASTRELTRLYALAQSNLLFSLDNVKKVADMRLDMMRVSGGAKPEAVFDPEASELGQLQQLPGLDAQSRDRVRKLVGGLVDAIAKDDSVDAYVDEEQAKETDPEQTVQTTQTVLKL